MNTKVESNSEAEIDEDRGPLWLLKTATAPKLGKNSEGKIHYQILTAEARVEPAIQIVSNDGGGYYSKELVPFHKIEDCVNTLPKGEAFPSKSLQAAYTGRSSNNAGFLAAILRSEGLLALAPDTEGRHIVAGDWGNWQSALLAEPGKLVESEPAPANSKASSNQPGQFPSKPADKASRKK
jgi:hypothetical protein